MDIEDAHKLRILTYDETEQLLLGFFSDEVKAKMRKRIIDEGITDLNERVVYMRASAIGTLIHECVSVFVTYEHDILHGSFEGSLLDHANSHIHSAYRHCVEVSRQDIRL